MRWSLSSFYFHLLGGDIVVFERECAFVSEFGRVGILELTGCLKPLYYTDES